MNHFLHHRFSIFAGCFALALGLTWVTANQSYAQGPATPQVQKKPYDMRSTIPAQNLVKKPAVRPRPTLDVSFTAVQPAVGNIGIKGTMKYTSVMSSATFGSATYELYRATDTGWILHLRGNTILRPNQPQPIDLSLPRGIATKFKLRVELVFSDLEMTGPKYTREVERPLEIQR